MLWTPTLGRMCMTTPEFRYNCDQLYATWKDLGESDAGRRAIQEYGSLGCDQIP